MSDNKTVSSPELEAVKAEITAMLEAAKREAAQIVEAASASAAQAPAAQIAAEKTAKPPGSEYLNEYVTVELFKDNSRYKNDVFVAVNGETCLIQRGKPVPIKRKFALALRNSLDQDQYAAKVMEGYGDQYREAEKAKAFS